MKILKFGGTSVGSPERIKNVADLINDGEQKIVVLSAMSGTTNTLVEIADYLRKRNPESASAVINHLRTTYFQHIEKLFSNKEMLNATAQILDDIFMHLHSFAGATFNEDAEKSILAQGELMSTNMMTNYLKELGVNVCLLPALDYMKIDENGEPDTAYINQHLREILDKHKGYDI